MASRKHHAAALALAAAVLLPLSSQASPFALAHAAEIESSKPSAAPTLGRQYSHLPAANSLHSSFNPYAMDAPIYHDSERWDWLSYPGKVVPGGQIINIDTGGQCSTGWIVSQKQRYFILTAGHCGRVYDRFAIRDRNGNSAVIGQMVERKNLSNNSSGDYALIELSTLQYVDPRLPGHNQVPGWHGVQWLKQNHPRTVCHLGYRTGESCGQYLGVDDLGYIHFRGIVDHGDSGGPVYVMIKGTPYAVGIISWGQPTNATDVAAQPIQTVMQRWGLTLHA